MQSPRPVYRVPGVKRALVAASTQVRWRASQLRQSSLSVPSSSVSCRGRAVSASTTATPTCGTSAPRLSPPLRNQTAPAPVLLCHFTRYSALPYPFSDSPPLSFRLLPPCLEPVLSRRPHPGLQAVHHDTRRHVQVYQVPPPPPPPPPRGGICQMIFSLLHSCEQNKSDLRIAIGIGNVISLLPHLDGRGVLFGAQRAIYRCAPFESLCCMT